VSEHAPPQERQTGFVLEVTIGAPVEVVWQALREPDQIRRWHGWHTDSLDAEVQLIFVDGATETGRYVLDIESGDRFELREHEHGTVVRLTRLPREQVEGQWADWYDDITEGWTSFVHQLRFALERHPGEERRTLFMSAAGHPARPLDEGLAVHPVFYRAENQQGYVLDDLGPGLLVVGLTPARPGKEPAAMAIVTTYGLDDDVFERQRAVWGEWWRGAYPDAEQPVG
jgi:uncharacterized protein YndB with AHSA1/START domain